MKSLRIAALALFGLVCSMMLADESHAQGLPLQDSIGGSYGETGGNWGGGYDNTGNGWYNSGYTYYQPQLTLAWSTTAYTQDANSVIYSLQSQGYTVYYQNRVINYNYYGPVYVTDIWAYVYR